MPGPAQPFVEAGQGVSAERGLSSAVKSPSTLTKKSRTVLDERLCQAYGPVLLLPYLGVLPDPASLALALYVVASIVVVLIIGYGGCEVIAVRARVRSVLGR